LLAKTLRHVQKEASEGVRFLLYCLRVGGPVDEAKLTGRNLCLAKVGNEWIAGVKYVVDGNLEMGFV
jgi:hypothetical protein